MKCSVLINNYNYAQYVCKAVDSVLSQTVLPEEIVIVDDGSVDGSTRLLFDTYGDNPRIKIVASENRGQLAAMNLGFMNSCGDILFFLDSDDEYDPCYLESALALYRDHPACDFLICGRRETGAVDRAVLRYENDVSLGFSVISTLYGEHWEGGPTSTLSARRWVLEAFMPLDLEPYWRIRADDCLVHGAAITGAKKYYLARPLVRYRIHDANRYHGRDFDADVRYKYKLRTKQLLRHLERKTCMDGCNVMKMMKDELNSSCPEVVRDKFRLYFKLICRADRRLMWKIAKLKLLVRNAFLSR
jgi:glycosyltransferase involved in cell wall biosynthesis